VSCARTLADESRARRSFSANSVCHMRCLVALRGVPGACPCRSRRPEDEAVLFLILCHSAQGPSRGWGRSRAPRERARARRAAGERKASPVGTARQPREAARHARAAVRGAKVPIGARSRRAPRVREAYAPIEALPIQTARLAHVIAIRAAHPVCTADELRVITESPDLAARAARLARRAARSTAARVGARGVRVAARGTVPRPRVQAGLKSQRISDAARLAESSASPTALIRANPQVDGAVPAGSYAELSDAAAAVGTRASGTACRSKRSAGREYEAGASVDSGVGARAFVRGRSVVRSSRVGLRGLALRGAPRREGDRCHRRRDTPSPHFSPQLPISKKLSDVA
jgi:hypothetical protein